MPVELIPTLGALFLRGGPVQDPALTWRATRNTKLERRNTKPETLSARRLKPCPPPWSQVEGNYSVHYRGILPDSGSILRGDIFGRCHLPSCCFQGGTSHGHPGGTAKVRLSRLESYQEEKKRTTKVRGGLSTCHPVPYTLDRDACTTKVRLTRLLTSQSSVFSHPTP